MLTNVLIDRYCASENLTTPNLRVRRPISIGDIPSRLEPAIMGT